MTDESQGPDEAEATTDEDQEDPAIGQTSKQRAASHAPKQRKLLKQQEKDNPEINWKGEVTREQLETLPGSSDIRAVASNRGYPIPPGGRARCISAFLQYQSQDPALG